jgi:hypothetical protein
MILKFMPTILVKRKIKYQQIRALRRKLAELGVHSGKDKVNEDIVVNGLDKTHRKQGDYQENLSVEPALRHQAW